MEIKKGELINFDPLNEELEINLIQDELEREKAETIGYYAMFELVNGFKKALYWSKEKCYLMQINIVLHSMQKAITI